MQQENHNNTIKIFYFTYFTVFVSQGNVMSAHNITSAHNFRCCSRGAAATDQSRSKKTKKVSDGPVKYFAFSNHVKTLMGWNYFDIKYVKNAQSPASLLKKGIVKKCALLATKIEGSTKYCYTGISNDWLTLNE